MNSRNILAVLLLTLVTALTGCGGKPPVPASADHMEGGGEGGAEGHPGVLRLTPEARRAAGIVFAPVGPAKLSEFLPLYGVIKPNAEAVRSVTARFPGVVRSVAAKIGDRVSRGTTLATVESNESLQVYPVTSPLAGVVTERFANEGEQAGAQPLFTVADLSSLWAELSVFPRDRGQIHVGHIVRVQVADGGLSSQGKVVFIAPLGSSNTQSLTARVLLENGQGQWTPGLYVRGEVAVSEATVPLAVPVAALQELEDGVSVFVETVAGIAPRVVRTGRNDGRQVEILEGLSAGELVVVEGSFVLKAELGKGSAAHDH